MRQVTIGFSAVQRLLTGRVAAVPAFWNVEGVALRERGHPVDIFKVERLRRAALPRGRGDHVAQPRSPRGAPTSGRRSPRSPRASTDVVAHPEPAVAQIVAAAGAADATLVRAQLRAVSPTYARGLRIQRAVIERWATWDAKVGIVKRRPDVSRAFAFGAYVSPSSAGRPSMLWPLTSARRRASASGPPVRRRLRPTARSGRAHRSTSISGTP